MKKPFLRALGAALYIVIFVTGLQATSKILHSQDGTFFIPMTMLSLFVLSAGVMGFLFLSEPITLLIENKKKEAVTFFGQTIGFFACFAALFGILVLLTQ